ncbi:hypothetical protein [Rhizorhapis sp.]|uniref:hypothetical protein n=1 Tax=Rhizorhapis sp. TaxID=1968842 RepID=UPI002B45A653|nr:hypothetical protein [Rhizorhapis sp.]HKR17168.1 hypothetical protein [Rhizorhapis sp.]HKX35090.1 hypothetical protein [Rhizorhapis sp.]
MSGQTTYLRGIALGMAAMLLTACGSGKGEGDKTVAMRDMEVVDGTATDAMTDLDGVQTEGIALPPAATATKPIAPAAETSNSTEEDTSEQEAVADQ